MRRTLALAAAALVPLLGTACAQEADRVDAVGGDAIALLQEAPDRAREAGSSRFEMVMDMTLPELGETSMTMSGAMDLDAQVFEVSMDMSQLFAALGEQTGEPAPFGDTMEMIVTPDAFYLRGAMFGDTWLTGSLEELTGGISGADLFSSTMNDPAAFLEFLRGVGGEPEVVGEEEVRGVGTTHYAAQFTFGEALDATPAEQRELIESLLDQVPADVRDTPIELDAWVDDEGLARRVQMDMSELMAGAGMAGADVTMTIELFDYGEPVEVEVPDPSETRPFAEAMGGAFGG